MLSCCKVPGACSRSACADADAMIDHDKLFKELLKSAFVDFLDLFMPEVSVCVDRYEKVIFKDKEIFTDLTGGISLEPDLVAIVKHDGSEAMFLIHVEVQSTKMANFPERMLYYYIWLHLKYKMPVYPIALCSYKSQTKQINTYETFYPQGTSILRFEFRQIQLSQLHWREYAVKPSVIAAGLMCTMSFDAVDMVVVELRCWDMIEELDLEKPLRLLIAKFIGAYLPPMTEEQAKLFQKELKKRPKSQQEKIMEPMTWWERDGHRKGLQKGLQKGLYEGQRQLLIKQLTAKFGQLDASILSRLNEVTPEELESLAIAVLDLESLQRLREILLK